MIVAGRALLVDDPRALHGLRLVLVEHARRAGTVPASVRQIADELDALVTALATDADVSSAGVAASATRSMSVVEAARTLRLEPHAVRDLCRRRVLTANHVDGRWRINPASVATYTPRRDR